MSLREALGIRKLGILIIAFFVPCFLIVYLFMYLTGLLSGPNSATNLFWVSFGMLAVLSFIVYTIMTVRFQSAASEKTVHVSSGIEQISKVIPRIIAENRWKLMEADQVAGRYKVRIGMSFWTWGQTLSIHLTKIDDMSTKVDVRCESPAQNYDWGRNQAVIERFCSELENEFKLRV